MKIYQENPNLVKIGQQNYSYCDCLKPFQHKAM